MSMNINKAIEILSTYDKEVDIPPIPDFKDALKLSIEALKRCKVLAENSPLWAAKPLPGETEGE